MRKLVSALAFAISAIVAAPASATTVINGPIPMIEPGVSVLASPDAILSDELFTTYTLIASKDVKITSATLTVLGIENTPGLIPLLATIKADYDISPPITPLIVDNVFSASIELPDIIIKAGGSRALFVAKDFAIGPDLSTQLSFVAASVPLPATLPLLAAGVGGIVLLRRRAKAAA